MLSVLYDLFFNWHKCIQMLPKTVDPNLGVKNPLTTGSQMNLRKRYWGKK